MKKTISFKKELEFPSMIGEVTAISLEHTLKFLDESNVAGDLEVSGRYKMTEASRLEDNFDYQLPVEILLTEKLDLATAKVDVEDFYYEIENDDTMICYVDVKVEGVEVIDDEPDAQLEPVILDKEDLKREEKQEEEAQLQLEERCIEEEKELPQKTQLVESVEEVTSPIELIEEEPVCLTVESVKEEVAPASIQGISAVNETKDEKRECDGEYMEKMEGEIMPQIEKEEQSVEVNQEVGSLFSSFKDSDETFATYSVYILRQEETIQTIIEKYHTTKEELEKYNDLTNLTIGTKIIIPTAND